MGVHLQSKVKSSARWHRSIVSAHGRGAEERRLQVLGKLELYRRPCLERDRETSARLRRAPSENV